MYIFLYQGRQNNDVSVQFIVISLNQGICEYLYSVEITKIKDLLDLLSIWEYHFCKIMLTIVSQCHRFVPFDPCTTSDFKLQTSDFSLHTYNSVVFSIFYVYNFEHKSNTS